MLMVTADPRWDDYLRGLRTVVDDVYFSSDYHRLHQIAGGVVAVAGIVREGDDQLIVPGLRVAIPGTDYWDLQSCNGYGGPLARDCVTQSALSVAWREWAEESRSAGAIAGFFRLHPLLDNARWLPPDALVRDDRYTVYVSLKEGLDSVWAAADSRHRNMVNRGRRSAGPPVWNHEFAWDSFPSLYRGAMERLQAPTRLQFGTQYFSVLRSIRGAEIVSVTDNDGVVGAAVFLFGYRWGHYHLAARRRDAPNYVGNLLLQAGLERAYGKGLEGVHFGGGVTSSCDDPLLRFKRSVGGELRQFRTARVVCNLEVFQRLTIQAGASASNWLLPYRSPEAGVLDEK